MTPVPTNELGPPAQIVSVVPAVQVSMTLSVATEDLAVPEAIRSMSSPVPQIPGGFISRKSTLGLTNGLTHEAPIPSQTILSSRPPSPRIPSGSANHSPAVVVQSILPVQPSFSTGDWKCFGCEVGASPMFDPLILMSAIEKY